MKHMSKCIVFACVAAGAMNPPPVFAQTTLSVRAGLSRATMSGDWAQSAAVKSRTGLTLGVSGTLPLQEQFSLRVDGAYVQKGARATDAWEKLDLNLDYIEFSGLGQVNFAPSGEPASFYAFAGPSLGIKAACNATDINLDEGSRDSDSCGDDIKGIDLGITGGVGAEMPFSDDMTVSVDLRYTLGIMSVDDGSADFKNRNLVLQVGVGFPVGD